MILVETISISRMRYLVDEVNHDYAKDKVITSENNEFTQKYLEEIITSTREITQEEAHRIFEEDNGFPTNYLTDYIIV